VSSKTDAWDFTIHSGQYRVRVVPEGRGYRAKLISVGIGTIMEPHGTTPTEALIALVRELYATESVLERKLAKAVVRYTALPIVLESSTRRAGTQSHATKKAPRHAAKSASEALVTKMLGRRVKSGWDGLVDGEILQWDPFGAGGTDVLVKDAASGNLTWYASHGLTPIDGKGALPSRSEVRKLREAEMAESMKKIGERWAKEPSPPRIRR